MAAPQVTPLVENQPHTGGFMISESRGHRARSQVTITAAKYLAGTVMGQILLGAAVSAVKASGANTGNGTFVLDVVAPIQANAIAGLYTLRCIEAVVNGGKFALIDPKGLSVGGPYIIVAGAGGTILINDRIKGVLTDGGVDFIVGDGFDITIAVGSLKAVAYDPTALDGRQYAAGILWEDKDATSADKQGTLIVRDAEVNLNELVWGANVTTQAQKDAAFATFSLVSLIGRTGL